MGRIKTIAGHFKEVMEEQPIKVMQNVHVLDEKGNLLFEEGGVKPLMKSIEVDAMVMVKNKIWIDQIDVPFTPEEEEARDAEEELHEIEKLMPLPLTDRQEMDLLLAEGPEAVKAKRAEHQKAMAEYQVIFEPAFEKAKEKNRIVREKSEGKI